MVGLRTQRKAAGLNQGQLAERVCVSAACICRYEKGARNPDARMMIKLARALGCTVDDLLGKEESA